MTCSKQTTSKYTSRARPPYDATQCEGSKKKGNDGKMYISRQHERGGVHKWYAVGTADSIAAAKEAKAEKSAKPKSSKWCYCKGAGRLGNRKPKCTACGKKNRYYEQNKNKKPTGKSPP